MAATLQWDTIQDASLTEEGVAQVRVRSGIVTDIDIDPTGSTDKEVLAKARDAVYAEIDPGDSWSVSEPNLRFRRLQVLPVAFNAARVLATFDTNNGGLLTSYIIRDDAFVQQVRTNMVPGTREPIVVSWTATAPATGSVPADNITFDVPLPVRAITVTSLNLGAPPTGYQEAVGYVNDATWYGKPVGYWLLTRFRSDVSKYQGSYAIEATAMSRNYADWSETGTLVNKLTGKYVTVDPTEITNMNALTYSRGIIYPGNGVVRVGPHPTTNFSTIFGFSS